MKTKNLHPTLLDNNFRMIPVGPDTFALVSPEDYPTLKNYTWRIVRANSSYYAKAQYTKNGKRRSVSMHRLIARTPFGLVCHHDNRKTLDNRRSNLFNMTKQAHKYLHMNNSLRIKFAPIIPDQKQFA